MGIHSIVYRLSKLKCFKILLIVHVTFNDTKYRTALMFVSVFNSGKSFKKKNLLNIYFFKRNPEDGVNNCTVIV